METIRQACDRTMTYLATNQQGERTSAHVIPWGKREHNNREYRRLALTRKICGILSTKLQKLALFKY